MYNKTRAKEPQIVMEVSALTHNEKCSGRFAMIELRIICSDRTDISW